LQSGTPRFVSHAERWGIAKDCLRGRDKDTGYCLIDIKESVPAAAPRLSGSRVFKDHASRVVEGAVHLSPFLGERMLGARLLGRSVVIRELLPQDLKLEMESMTVDEAITAARHLSFIVGRAHARQMDSAMRRKWNATLKRSRPTVLDAP
jgi:uncharacterized protein (DUF2252 family)